MFFVKIVCVISFFIKIALKISVFALDCSHQKNKKIYAGGGEGGITPAILKNLA